MRLPQEKRDWKPAAQARSALNQVAECAIMNGSVIEMIRSNSFPDTWAYLYYEQQITELCADWLALQKLLHENTAAVGSVIRA